MGNSGGRIRVQPLEGDAANLEGGAEGGQEYQGPGPRADT